MKGEFASDAPAERDIRLAALFERRHEGIRPGLELMEELLTALGNPERSFLSVHVAGTNGKGSCCVLVESMLRAMGLRTGLYSSPHLVQVNERIRLGEADLSDEAFFHALDQIHAVEAELSRLPTFFECLTAAAFLAFAEAGVQVAVLEVGMGGRLDATNVVQPLCSVITRVDMDHMEFLGESLSKIAFEKAGILKAGRPVVMAPQEEAAAEVIRARAEALNCPLLEVEQRVSLSARHQDLSGQRFVAGSTEKEWGRLRIPLLGGFQGIALATALSVLLVLEEQMGLELETELLREALQEIRWPARCQLLQAEPLRLLDVAHNPGGAVALRDTLKELLGPKAKVTLICGMMKDKDAPGLLKALAPICSRMLCVSPPGERAYSAEALAAMAAEQNIAAEALSLEEARRLEEEEPGAVVIAGSLYLAGEWLRELKRDPGERG